MSKASIILGLFLVLFAEARDRGQLSKGVEQRTGHTLSPKQSRDFSLPPGIVQAGSVTEDQAVAVALWNNVALEAVLADLSLSRADLIEAGLIRNPNLAMLLPVGAKPFELLLTLPAEALWQRRRRVEAARISLDQVTESLIIHGLNLARDVRLAHAELAAAQDRAATGAESARLRQQIADVTNKRLQAGDISDLDAAAVRLEARTAAERQQRFSLEIPLAAERLRFLLNAPVAPVAVATPVEGQPARADIAAASRPDLRAAELAVEAATRRARWERSRIYALGIALSSKGVGSNGILSGPGLNLDLPVFHRNQGQIARADAEVERASLQYLALRRQVDTEVREAQLQLTLASSTLDRIRRDLLPAAEDAFRLARKALQAGDASRLFVLENSRAAVDLRMREADAVLAVRRARAHLDRNTGSRQ